MMPSATGATSAPAGAPRRAARDVVIDSLRGSIAWSDALNELLGRSHGEPGLEQAPNGPVLLLSPHLDDAVLSCWSVLTGPAAVEVVNVFSGIPPEGTLARPDRITGAQDSSTQMKLRIEEDHQALALADRKPGNLMFLEVGYRHRAPSLRGLLDAVRRTVSAVSAVWAPAGLGGNPDHRLARALGRRIAGVRIPLTLYAELPHAAALGWPYWVTNSARLEHLDVDAYWAPFLAGAPIVNEEATRRVRELDDREMGRKLEAIRLYRTQYPALTRGPLDVLADARVLRYEVAWTTEPSDPTGWPRRSESG